MANEPTLTTALLWGWGSQVLSVKGSCQAQGRDPKQQTEPEATRVPPRPGKGERCRYTARNRLSYRLVNKQRAAVKQDLHLDMHSVKK